MVSTQGQLAYDNFLVKRLSRSNSRPPQTPPPAIARQNTAERTFQRGFCQLDSTANHKSTTVDAAPAPAEEDPQESPAEPVDPEAPYGRLPDQYVLSSETGEVIEIINGPPILYSPEEQRRANRGRPAA